MKDNYNISGLKPTKKRKNSRRKGNLFENEIAKQLNSFFEVKDFCRTPGSGAFATTHNLPEHLRIKGDLITPKNFKFFIECKKGYNKESICSLFSHNSDIRQWIRKANKEVYDREFIILFRQDRQRTICITKQSNFNSYYLINQYLISKDGYLICLLEDLLSVSTSSEWFLDNPQSSYSF